MSDSTIVKTIFIAADAATVWDYLTDKDKLGEWFYSAASNLRVGEDYRLFGTDDDGSESDRCWGTVRDAQPGEKLVYTFTFGPFGGATTTVTWLLNEVHGGTRLTLQHEGSAEAAGDAALMILGKLDSGWDRHLGLLREAAKR
jgi:uncharacterized protein YndB with AHSA1/START domain